MDTKKDYTDIFNSSRARCKQNTNFYPEFFEQLITQLPMSYGTLFENVDRLKLAEKLDVSFDNIGAGEELRNETTLLDQWQTIAEKHKDMNITGDLFEIWFCVLLRVVKKYDPQFDDHVETAWRHKMSPDLAYMRLHCPEKSELSSKTFINLPPN